MTLTEAIEKVGVYAPWHFQMLETSGDAGCDRAVVAILNAALSGELVPATDAHLAVALVMAERERCARIAAAGSALIDRWDSKNWVSGHTLDFITELRAAIRAGTEGGE